MSGYNHLCRIRITGVVVALITVLGALAFPGAATAASPVPGTRPDVTPQSVTPPLTRAASLSSAAPLTASANGGLQLVVNERGHLSRSIAGVTSDTTSGGTLTLNKPLGATVRKAYMAIATTGFTATPLTDPITVDGQPVSMDNMTPTGISSYNYFTDVTGLVKPKLDAAAGGPVSFNVAEPQPALTDGEIVEVIYDDPSVTADQTVSILFGALSPTGDKYTLNLASPIALGDPSTHLEMSLGISYSYQSGGTQQYSIVDVNGQRLTTAAGGEDDGQPHNGALLTVGGDGDSLYNPADPNATPTNPRSDDELYDLRPFVRNGDQAITVTTSNPSLDDNIFFASFTMNPPVTEVSTGKDFVYVALGDSYSSGEGAGFNIRPQDSYLSQAYESGNNYPDSVGPQASTYTAALGGDACHRALLNYAKINRDKLDPGANIILVDRTCSGAKIEPGDKPPVVGTAGGAIDPNSQLQQVLDRLKATGHTAADVSLVTVGMGGNDARFGDIVAACVLPALLSELLDRYPNAPSEIRALANRLSCSEVDNGIAGYGGFHTDDAIKQLTAKEEWAQQQILSAFPNARVLQVDYPDILPAKNTPAWCGGLRAGDVDYARKKIKKIDSAVRSAVSNSASADSRLQLVEEENTFGNNALCPASAADQLTNGISKANVDTEIDRLLNVDNKGDAMARAKLDSLVSAWKAYKACLANQLNPFDRSSCNLSQSWANVEAKAADLMNYMKSQQTTIFGNLVSPPGTSDDRPDVAFDRSRGLFHPNARGHGVQACDVLNAWNGTSSDCTSAPAPSLGTVNGQPFGNSPILVAAKQALDLVVNGFQSLSRVHLQLFSTPADLGDVTTDKDGVVRTSVTLPTLNPGVHVLELDGEGADGVQITRQIVLRISGRPTVEYATYLCCFDPEPAQIPAGAPQEAVTVTLSGIDLGTYAPDEDGGVLVNVPSVDRLTDPSALVLEAKSNLTGKVVRETINPIPSAPSLWALSSDDTALSIAGSGFAATGRVHSEGGITIRGSKAVLSGGVEYVSKYDTQGSGAQVNPAAAKVARGQGSPPIPDIADYRPSGSIARSGVTYRAISPSACTNGVWTPGVSDNLTGVVYVPCSVRLVTGRTYAATIAAEGTIQISGSGTIVGPTTPGAPSLISGASAAAITISGPGIILRGTAYAANGTFRANTSNLIMQCGVIASFISVQGSGSSAPMSGRCLM